MAILPRNTLDDSNGSGTSDINNTPTVIVNNQNGDDCCNESCCNKNTNIEKNINENVEAIIKAVVEKTVNAVVKKNIDEKIIVGGDINLDGLGVRWSLSDIFFFDELNKKLRHNLLNGIQGGDIDVDGAIKNAYHLSKQQFDKLNGLMGGANNEHYHLTSEQLNKLNNIPKDGVKGDKGDKGDTGPQGPKGDKGDKGDTGSQGLKGDPGTTNHENLNNLMGGDNNEHFHLTQKQWERIVELTDVSDELWNNIIKRLNDEYDDPISSDPNSKVYDFTVQASNPVAKSQRKLSISVR